MPVTRFVAPGPEVVIATPGFPVTRAKPSAACAAPCSCRIVMCLISLSRISSKTGIMLPPIIPKVVLTPSLSRALTRAFDPVILSTFHHLKILGM